MNTHGIEELDLVALWHDLPECGLVAGDVGTVVMVCRDGAAYEVEFVAADGDTISVETLGADRVTPVAGRRILHVRDLAPA